MATGPIPKGFTALTPSISMKGADKAIEFYKAAFGATQDVRLDMPDGSIAHAELLINGGRIMLAEENPQFNMSPSTLGGTTVVLHLYVDDVDAVFKRAIELGATETMAIADQFYGDRSGRVKDPYGYVWVIATHIEDVPDEEMKRRFAEMCGG